MINLEVGLNYQNGLNDLGKSAKKAAKAIGTAITKTVQAMQLSVGGG